MRNKTKTAVRETETSSNDEKILTNEEDVTDEVQSSETED